MDPDLEVLSGSASKLKALPGWASNGCGVSVSEYSCAQCTWSPYKLWRSNSIFNYGLWPPHGFWRFDCFCCVHAVVGVTAVVDVPIDTCAGALVGVPAVVGVTAMVDVPTDAMLVPLLW